MSSCFNFDVLTTFYCNSFVQVQVIICVREKPLNHGTNLTASVAAEAIGGLLPLNHPLSLLSPKPDRSHSTNSSSSSCISIDSQRKQVVLTNPNTNRRRGAMATVPKVFGFDSIFTDELPMVSNLMFKAIFTIIEDSFPMQSIFACFQVYLLLIKVHVA